MSSTKGANNLTRFLNNANYSANTIHGKKSQLTRLVIFNSNLRMQLISFQAGKYRY